MTTFASLRVRNYRLFASGQVVSLTGTWMQRVAQDWLVLELSHNSGTAVGITTGLQFAPILLFGLYGGVIADRFSKRRILLATQAAMGLLALTLGVLDVTGAVQLWHVYALAFGLGLATAVDTPARQAFVSELVGPTLLPNAVSLNSATFNTARVMGPAVAGVMIAATGTGWVFLVNTASFVAVLSGLLLMRDEDLFVGKRIQRRPGAIREGLAYVRTRPDLLALVTLVGIIGTLGFNFQLTTALIAKATFHRGPGSYGLLGTAFAAGSLLGALASARRGRPRQRLVLGAAFAFGLCEMAVGLMPTYWSFFALLIPTGFVTLTFTTAANTTVQLRHLGGDARSGHGALPPRLPGRYAGRRPADRVDRRGGRPALVPARRGDLVVRRGRDDHAPARPAQAAPAGAAPAAQASLRERHRDPAE